jgi:NADPH-dependent glutamate synthase beta subunit-like oxidoreductase
MGNGRTHRPELDTAKCGACGGCTWRCPATVLPSLRREEDSLRGALYTARPYPGTPAETPPCAMTCPLGQDVPGYVSAIARGELAEAARIIRTTNALPSACGRLCLASCMRACSRAFIDEGLDIRGLKKVAVDAISAPSPVARKALGFKVAVVGAGPSGLAAAHRLADLGVSVTVFEAEDNAGGMLADTVPAFMMPAEALAADVAAIVESGVSIRIGVRVGRDVAVASLEKEFAAVLVTTGARRGLLPALRGGDLKGVVDAVSFCRTARRDASMRISGDVVVLGGGQAALQAARLALKIGASSAKVVYPKPRAAWPAGEDALRTAEKEGVAIFASMRAVAFEGTNGAVSTVTVRTVKTSAEDRVGRTVPAAGGAEQSLPAETVVASGDRRPDHGLVLDGVALGVLGNFTVDASYRLGRARWYAAGEAATGAATVVDSMATGRRAAESIVADLNAEIGGGR